MKIKSVNRLYSLMIIMMTTVLFLQLISLAYGSDESCINCHLHSELTKDFVASGFKIKTLAGFHGQAFKHPSSKHQASKQDGQDSMDAGCQACHESRQTMGKLPSSKVCLGCHTYGKTAQGDSAETFHAEEKHWPMEKVACASCHQGHVAGSPAGKFLTINAINMCQQCHKKSFRSVTESETSKTKTSIPENESDNRYGQN